MAVSPAAGVCPPLRTSPVSCAGTVMCVPAAVPVVTEPPPVCPDAAHLTTPKEMLLQPPVFVYLHVHLCGLMQLMLRRT